MIQATAAYGHPACVCASLVPLRSPSAFSVVEWWPLKNVELLHACSKHFAFNACSTHAAATHVLVYPAHRACSCRFNSTQAITACSQIKLDSKHDAANAYVEGAKCAMKAPGGGEAVGMLQVCWRLFWGKGDLWGGEAVGMLQVCWRLLGGDRADNCICCSDLPYSRRHNQQLAHDVG